MMERIRQAIRDAKELSGLSYDKIAEKAEHGVSGDWIQRVVTGGIKENPGREKLMAVCEALGLDYDQLITGTEYEQRKQQALQLGTNVLELAQKVIAQDSIPIAIYSSSDIKTVLGMNYLKITEGTKHMAGHNMIEVINEGADCHPFSLPGERLRVATDITPDEGDPVVFKGSDSRYHVGTYHIDDDIPHVIRGHGLSILLLTKDNLIGPVIERAYPVKLLKPLAEE